MANGEDKKIQLEVEIKPPDQQSIEEAKKGVGQLAGQAPASGGVSGVLRRLQSPGISPERNQELATAFSGTLAKFSSNQFIAGLGGLISTPGSAASASGIAGTLATTGVSSILGAAGTAAGGPLGGVIAQAMSGPLNKFVDRFFAKRQQVEQEAIRDVQLRAKDLAKRGISVSDEDIGQALDMSRAQSRRVIDMNERIARQADLTNDTVEGILSSSFRRGLDALIG